MVNKKISILKKNKKNIKYYRNKINYTNKTIDKIQKPGDCGIIMMKNEMVITQFSGEGKQQHRGFQF